MTLDHEAGHLSLEERRGQERSRQQDDLRGLSCCHLRPSRSRQQDDLKGLSCCHLRPSRSRQQDDLTSVLSCCHPHLTGHLLAVRVFQRGNGYSSARNTRKYRVSSNYKRVLISERSNSNSNSKEENNSNSNSEEDNERASTPFTRRAPSSLHFFSWRRLSPAFLFRRLREFFPVFMCGMVSVALAATLRRLLQGALYTVADVCGLAFWLRGLPTLLSWDLLTPSILIFFVAWADA